MSARLRDLAKGLVSGPLSSDSLAGTADQQASLETLIDSAPETIRELVREWLSGEGVQDMGTLRAALVCAEDEDVPMLLERARKNAITGVYLFLRETAQQLGGGSRQSAGLRSSTHANSLNPVGNSELPDFRRLRQLLEAADFGEPTPGSAR